MDRWDYLESESIYVIREAYSRYERMGILWSAGKDSTALLWICRRAFLGEIPIPVIHIDTGRKLPAIYEFRDRLTAAWGLDLRIFRNEKALADGMNPENANTLKCCQALKTEALKLAISELGLDAVLVGVRRDEHGVRAKERYFSPRNQDFIWAVGDQPPELWDLYPSTERSAHDRVHPLLHMTELDIWRYTLRWSIPVNPLYFSRDGWRYRSIGCAPCCVPVASEAATIEEVIAELEQSRDSERAGRRQDKETAFSMQKLRSLGYM